MHHCCVHHADAGIGHSRQKADLNIGNNAQAEALHLDWLKLGGLHSHSMSMRQDVQSDGSDVFQTGLARHGVAECVMCMKNDKRAEVRVVESI